MKVIIRASFGCWQAICSFLIMIQVIINECDHEKRQRRNTMKSSTKDQAEGKFHQGKGHLKEVAGKLSDNPKLEAEGTGEKIAGKVQEKIGQINKVLGK
jgi:uncharacterized protein YjbJ (UPF0337 family)